MLHCIELDIYKPIIFKDLLETINKIKTDINIIFSQDNITIKEVNIYNTILYTVILPSKSLDKYIYNYQHDKLLIGLNIQSILTILSSVSNNDIMKLHICLDKLDELFITIYDKIYNVSKTSTIKLNKSYDNNLVVSTVNYDIQYNLNSLMIARILKDLANTNDNIELNASQNSLILLSNNIEYNIKPSKHCLINISKSFKKSIISKYSLQWLYAFNKCASMSENTIFYISENTPLIIEYSISSYGIIRIAFSKII